MIDHQHIWESCSVADWGQICADCGVEMSILTVHENEEFLKSERLTPLEEMTKLEENANVGAGRARTKPPGLTPAQIERLAILMEECGEVVQAAGKILRHGYGSTGHTNIESLEREMGDVLAAITMMHRAKDVSMPNVEKRVDEKLEKIKKYLHHQE